MHLKRGRRMNPPARRCLYLSMACLLVATFAGGFQVLQESAAKENANMICFVCHVDLQKEKITTVHLEIGLTCQKCHGATTEHMHDETLMTKPDVLWGRAEVNEMCSRPSCHAPGQGRDFYTFEDHANPAAVEAFLQDWVGKRRPNGRTIASDSVCTDCHGTHNIDRQSGRQTMEEETADWVVAFNGEDLEGWECSGSACWSVENGRITALPGDGPEPGSLWTESEYEDYLMAVTFRATWPIHAGIWIRGSRTQQGPRIEIFDNKEPPAHTGSLHVSGKGIVLVNLREDLVDREGWNTLSVKVEGDRVQIWLNGKEIGAVRTGGPEKGKLGFYIEKLESAEAEKFSIREVLLKPLEK